MHGLSAKRSTKMRFFAKIDKKSFGGEMPAFLHKQSKALHWVNSNVRTFYGFSYFWNSHLTIYTFTTPLEFFCRQAFDSVIAVSDAHALR